MLSLRGSVVATAAAALLVLAACEDKKLPTSSAAAKVNQEEVGLADVDRLLQQQRGLKPEQADAASRQILERLIDQELAQQKAVELKLEREPRVVQQLEAARREILARAYVDKVGEAAAKPTAEDVGRYYGAHPALFKERRVYNLQEIVIEAKPEQTAQLQEQLARSKNVGEFVDYLKASDLRFAANQALRAAEQLPLASLGRIAALKDGQGLLTASPNGAQVIVLAGSRAQPVTLEQATPAIEQFLLNERRRELVAKDLKTLRAGARIEYVGKFAQPAASAPEPAASN